MLKIQFIKSKKLSNYHTPVLLKECIEGLNIQPNGVYVDATFGGGGHTRAILKSLGKDGKLIAFDQDENTIQNLPKDPRLIFVNENFKHLKRFLRLHNSIPVDGILADLGVSSYQFDNPERGFSIRENADLDMRMDKRNSKSARNILNEMEERKLFEMFKNYGELKQAKKIANAIVIARLNKKIQTIFDLKTITEKFKGNEKPNKFFAKMFQAIRIELNQEIEVLKFFLNQCQKVLKPNGRLVVISYHSLEDRLVKKLIRSGNVEGKIEKDFYGNPINKFKAVNRKVVLASPEEIIENPRSRSAKLRIAEIIEDKLN